MPPKIRGTHGEQKSKGLRTNKMPHKTKRTADLASLKTELKTLPMVCSSWSRRGQDWMLRRGDVCSAKCANSNNAKKKKKKWGTHVSRRSVAKIRLCRQSNATIACLKGSHVRALAG
jgi:hypothetical protein